MSKPPEFTRELCGSCSFMGVRRGSMEMKERPKLRRVRSLPSVRIWVEGEGRVNV
jgi:hypothetical protein